MAIPNEDFVHNIGVWVAAVVGVGTALLRALSHWHAKRRVEQHETHKMIEGTYREQVEHLIKTIEMQRDFHRDQIRRYQDHIAELRAEIDRLNGDENADPNRT